MRTTRLKGDETQKPKVVINARRANGLETTITGRILCWNVLSVAKP